MEPIQIMTHYAAASLRLLAGRFVVRILSGLPFLLVASGATAGDGSGTVQIAHVYPPSLVFFFTSQRSNAPACANVSYIPGKRWVLDVASTEGRAKYAVLLSAQLAGKPVIVAGTGNCALWGDSETVSWVGFPVDASQVQ